MRTAVVLVLLSLAARPAAAHGMRSVYLSITETAPGRAHLAIRGSVPFTGVALTAASPCTLATTELTCPDTLAGAELTVTGMGPIASEAIVFLSFLDGTTTTACVTPGAPTWRIPGGDSSAIAVAARYVRLGIDHIAGGADHLLFLLGLVLCLRRLRAVLLAETAFTLSHTLSFSAAALGWIHVSPAAAEACIAVSLLLVALDIARRPTPRSRRPARSFGRGADPAGRDGWLDARRDGGANTSADACPDASVEPRPDTSPDACPDARRTAGLAFAFGLVHGLGFAGGLAEIGLPASAVPAALAGFAGGVEIGQVAFLALAIALLRLVGRAPRLARAALPLCACAIGGIGCFWLLERLSALG